MKYSKTFQQLIS